MSVELGFVFFVGAMFFLVMAYDRFYKKHCVKPVGNHVKDGYRVTFGTTNPSSGLPMNGFVDVSGNTFGSGGFGGFSSII
jgi:hypothetical protein